MCSYIHIGSNTYCVITSKLIHKVTPYIKKDLYDIVKTDWLIKCIKNKLYYPWSPSDMWHSIEKTRKQFEKKFDKYGDSYIDDIGDNDQLKRIFNNIDNMNVKFDESNIHYKIAFIENKYFPDESSEYGLFRLCNVYLDLYKMLNRSIPSDEMKIECSGLDLIKLKIIWYGAVISDTIDDETTHCVIDKR